METTSIALLTIMAIGAVELVKRIATKDWTAVGIILSSAVVGGLGSLMFDDISLPIGIVIGLGASGIITSVSKIGGKTIVDSRELG
jgi:hypothetical protein